MTEPGHNVGKDNVTLQQHRFTGNVHFFADAD